MGLSEMAGFFSAVPVPLVLLTTAMAWGMAPDMDGDADGTQKKARVTLSQSAAGPSGQALETPQALPRPGDQTG